MAIGVLSSGCGVCLSVSQSVSHTHCRAIPLRRFILAYCALVYRCTVEWCCASLKPEDLDFSFFKVKSRSTCWLLTCQVITLYQIHEAASYLKLNINFTPSPMSLNGSDLDLIHQCQIPSDTHSLPRDNFTQTHPSLLCFGIQVHSANMSCQFEAWWPWHNSLRSNLWQAITLHQGSCFIFNT